MSGAATAQVWLTGSLVVALAATFAQGVPQAVRTVVHRRAGGLSPLTMWAVLLLNTVWLAFAITVKDPLLAAGNAVTTGCAAAVLLAHHRTLGIRRPTPLDGAGLLLLGVVGACGLAGEAGWLSSAAAALGVLWGLPQLVRLLRDRHVDGVAPGTYAVALVGLVAFTVHWALAGQHLLLASCVYTLAQLTVSLLVLTWRRRREAAATMTPEPSDA